MNTFSLFILAYFIYSVEKMCDRRAQFLALFAIKYHTDLSSSICLTFI